MVVNLKIVFFVLVTRVLSKVQFIHLSQNHCIKMAFGFVHHHRSLESWKSHWDIIQSEKSGIVNKQVKVVVVEYFNE